MYTQSREEQSAGQKNTSCVHTLRTSELTAQVSSLPCQAGLANDGASRRGRFANEPANDRIGRCTYVCVHMRKSTQRTRFGPAKGWTIVIHTDGIVSGRIMVFSLPEKLQRAAVGKRQLLSSYSERTNERRYSRQRRMCPTVRRQKQAQPHSGAEIHRESPGGKQQHRTQQWRWVTNENTERDGAVAQ